MIIANEFSCLTKGTANFGMRHGCLIPVNLIFGSENIGCCLH